MNKKVLILGVGTLLLALITFFKPLRFFDNLFYDLNFSLIAHDAADSVLVVGVDYKSIRELGAFPWPRSRMAYLIEKISSGSPNCIALDFLFPRRPGKDENDSLSAVFSRTQNLVLPFRAGGITNDRTAPEKPVPADIMNFRFLRYSNPEKLENIPFYAASEIDAADTLFSRYARYGGFLNVSTSSSSQKIREAIHVIKVGREYFPSFCISAVTSYYGASLADLVLDGNGKIIIKDTEIPLTSYAATTFINFRNQKRPIPEISAVDVLNGTVDPSVFKGKLVFAGVTDPMSGADFFITPVVSQFPGVKIWATMALDILQKSWVRIDSPLLVALNWILLLFIFPGLAILFPGTKKTHAFISATAAVILSLCAGFYTFHFLNSYWESSSHIYAWLFSLVWLAVTRVDPSLAGVLFINLEPGENDADQIIPTPSEQDFSDQVLQTDTAIFATRSLLSRKGGEYAQLSGSMITGQKTDSKWMLSGTISPDRGIVEEIREIADGKIIRTLGSGGMADVYLVWNPRLELYRAVKVIKPGQSETFKTRFETELRIFSKLDHPNIVHCYGVGDWYSLPCLEMEFVNGASTDEILKKCELFSVEQALAIGIQVAKALHYAHNQTITIYGKICRGIVHRDLKPANIILSRSGRVKLTDFGIARPLDVSLHTVEFGNVVGTLPYLAPEQFSSIELTCKTDIYALGATLYEFITGERAFPQTEIPALVTAKNCGDYKPLESLVKISPEVSGVIDKALSVDPSRRYSSANAFRVDLERAFFSLAGNDGYRHLSQLVKRFWN
jgi:CHASE2 domain-containing sensor protein